jgi:hypothetical protein
MNADTIQIASYKGFRDGYAVGEYANPYDSNDPNHVQYEEGYDCGISAWREDVLGVTACDGQLEWTSPSFQNFGPLPAGLPQHQTQDT